MMRRLLLAVLALAAAAASGPLKSGDVFPALSGQTLSGKPIELPAANAGAMRLAVVTFAKAAAGDSKLWCDQASKDGGPGLIVFRALMMEAVPKLFRGMAASGVKGSMPQSYWETTILSYKDEDKWRQYVAQSSDKEAYLVLMDGSNHVCWTGRGPYSAEAYAGLKSELARCGRNDAK
jgi:hypothetical protein